jgi:hypothetical protein
VFDAGHCRTCARQAGLLDHYHHVQKEEARLRQASAYARAAHRYALWALGLSRPLLSMTAKPAESGGITC